MVNEGRILFLKGAQSQGKILLEDTASLSAQAGADQPDGAGYVSGWRKHPACGRGAQTVSNIARVLDIEVEHFHSRRLGDVYRYLFFDGICLKVKGAGKVLKRHVLCVYGISLTGER